MWLAWVWPGTGCGTQGHAGKMSDYADTGINKLANKQVKKKKINKNVEARK